LTKIYAKILENYFYDIQRVIAL
jgi:hypothetical protein